MFWWNNLQNGELHSKAHWYRRPWSTSQDNLLHAYWLNYFSRAEGVPKAIENVEIRGVCVLYLILRFARSLAYHHAHTTDIYDYLFYRYFGCQCSTVEKSPRGGSKMNGYALELTVAISQQCCIDNQNIHNTNSHTCLSCVRDDMLNF